MLSSPSGQFQPQFALYDDSAGGGCRTFLALRHFIAPFDLFTISSPEQPVRSRWVPIGPRCTNRGSCVFSAMCQGTRRAVQASGHPIGGSAGWFLPRCGSCLRRATWPNFSCPLRQREYQILCSTNRRCRAVKTGSLIRRARGGCFALAELAPEPIPRLCQTVCGKRRLWFVEKRVNEEEGMAAKGQPANAVLRWWRLSHSEDARAQAPDSSLSPKVAVLSCLSAVRTRAL